MTDQGVLVTNRISVVLTTYERDAALQGVLRGLAQQSHRNFEVVIADDGSGPATRELIDHCRARLGVPLIHVWQEDQGFRASEARNRAILASSGSYCIFLDGDCIPRPNFVELHRRLAEPGWFVAGNRVLLSRELTERVLADSSDAENWRFSDWVALRSRWQVNRIAPLLALPLGPLRKLRLYSWQQARSCNLAVWRSDLDRVDGFDASYNGWGLEDSDLLVRLLRAGVRRKDGTFATGVLHLWHPRDRSSLPDNARRLEAVRHADRVRAIAGLSALESAVQCGAGTRKVRSHG